MKNKIVDFFINTKKVVTNRNYKTKENYKYESIKVLNGTILANLNKARTLEILDDLQTSEFQVFSQWGDDGIIQFLVDYLKVEHKSFIEFGVENFSEANTRFLLIKNNWSGLIIDGSEKNIKYVQKDDVYWKYNLSAVTAFVTRENINSLIQENGFAGDIGLLHIDIDGNDYWIWKQINCISPVIVIIEYNSVFGFEKSWTIPYKENFYRTSSHFSNLYYGSSLLSLCNLAKEKGYSFIGCNSNGNNAYFVRKDRVRDLKILDAKQGYVESKFRESRDREGNLTFLKGRDRLIQIKGLEVYNTQNNQIEKIS